MASIPVTIIGTMTYTDIGIGGGPIIGSEQPPGQPPGIWPSPGHPAHPIAPGGSPPQVWPGPGYPSNPIAPGGAPPEVWPGPGQPAHPIAGLPPGVWPSPGHPENPIVIPPGQEPPKTFTVIVKNDATGEWKAITFVPSPEVPPATPGEGPKV
jgi:hypothetical protein